MSLVCTAMLLLVIFHTGCDSGTTGAPTGFQWYQDYEYDYRLMYPQDWNIMPDDEGTIVDNRIKSVKMFKEPSDDSSAQVAVFVYSEYDLNELKALGGNETRLNRREACRLDQGSMIIVAVAGDEYDYTIVCVAEPDLFLERLEVFDRIIESFALP